MSSKGMSRYSLFKKEKKVPVFTFYDPKEDVNFIQSKKTDRLAVADEATAELSSMIGLDNIKKWIINQKAVINLDQRRRENGINITNNQTMHMVFLGNPGTGKTECARLIAKIYYGLEIMPTDSFVEVSRRELIGDGYKTSAEKVNEIFKEAIGGVLFIDEAYSLCYGPADQNGREAVDTLLKLMEDYRDSIVVIMAGYTNEMLAFLKTNPGFESRIPANNKLTFFDYTEDELVSIFKYMIKKNGYILAKDVTDDNIRVAIRKMPKTKGNARDIRNFLDNVKMNLDLILNEKSCTDQFDLITITNESIKAALL